MFAAVMVKSGLSPAYGSGWWPPGWKFAKPALADDRRPPSHAGMLPAALPAFSPPSGVRSAPRRAASWAVMPAFAAGMPAMSAAVRAQAPSAAITFLVCMVILPRSEGVLEARREEIAVVEIVPAAGAAVARVVEIHIPAALQVQVDADRGGDAPVDEVAAGPGRRADVVLQGIARAHVPRTDEAQVIEATSEANAPGRRVREAVLRFDFVEMLALERKVSADRRAGAVVAQALAVRAARELVREALEMREADFTDDHHLRGAQHVGERLGCRHLHLDGVVAVPALHFLVEPEAAELAAGVERRGRARSGRTSRRQRDTLQRCQPGFEGRQRAEQQFHVVVLDRRIHAIGQLAL